MVWKCPKCPHKSQSHAAMMKHYYAKHYKPKAGAKGSNKGKEKKIYVFHPLKGR